MGHACYTQGNFPYAEISKFMKDSRGQALVEYLLMTVMLPILFTSLYRFLQNQLAFLFTKAGKAILYAYY
jgi:Flp pilus assembly pilin Flp